MLTRALTFSPGVSPDAARSALFSPLPAFPAAAAQQARQRRHTRTLTLASNSDVFVSPLVRTLTRAEELLAVGAYVHWYERYGTTADDIAESVNSLLDVVEAYRPGGASASVAAALSPPSWPLREETEASDIC
jgi:hypothetical protein